MDFPQYLGDKGSDLSDPWKGKYSILIGLQINSPKGVRKPSFWSYLPDVILGIIFYLLLMCSFTPLFYYFYDDTS